jgi:hypothetical protein
MKRTFVPALARGGCASLIFLVAGIMTAVFRPMIKNLVSDAGCYGADHLLGRRSAAEAPTGRTRSVAALHLNVL